MYVAALIEPTFWIAVVTVYLLLRFNFRECRTLAFGIANLAVMGWLFGGLIAVAALAVSIATYLGLSIARKFSGRQRVSRALRWGVIAFAAAIYLVYKMNLDYQTMLTADWPTLSVKFSYLMNPLGTLAFSFVILRLWTAARAVLVDGERLLTPISLSGYLAPFFMLGAGPINSYSEHLGIDDQGPSTPEQFNRLLNCVELITTGLVFKFVLARAILFFSTGLAGGLPLTSWADSAYFLIYTYFDFAGYSLIALGIGKLIGIPTPVNFKRPFLARTVTEFWQRWHMSLGEFVRIQIFMPLQIRLIRRFRVRNAYWAGAVSLCIAFAFVGLWHRLTLQFLIWGVTLGGVMVMEKKILEVFAGKLARWPRQLAAVIGPAYVFLVISLSLLLVARQMAPQ